MTRLLTADLANAKLHDQLVVLPIIDHDPFLCLADNPEAHRLVQPARWLLRLVTPSLIVVIWGNADRRSINDVSSNLPMPRPRCSLVTYIPNTTATLSSPSSEPR